MHHLKQFTPPAALDLSQYINCPKYTDVQMQRSVCGTDIEIDTCPDCGGIWLDFGELEKLRDVLSVVAEGQSDSQKFEAMLLSSEAYQEYKKVLDQKVQEDERCDKPNQLHQFLFNCLY